MKTKEFKQMKTQEAKALLQKYFDGLTSLEEDRILKDFFLQESLPEEFMPYKKWFTGIGMSTPDSKPETIENDMIRMIREQQKPVRFLNRKFIVAISGIAASLIIVAGSMLYYLRQPDYRDTFNDPAQAMAYAEKTLAFVSSEYNKGLASLAPVSKLNGEQQKLGKSMKTIRKGFTEYNKIQIINKIKSK
jgi:hypothetical protein